MTIDTTRCAVCRKPLNRKMRREVERGDYTCAICGAVFAICAECYRLREEKAEAMEARSVAHFDACEADVIATREADCAEACKP